MIYLSEIGLYKLTYDLLLRLKSSKYLHTLQKLSLIIILVVNLGLLITFFLPWVSISSTNFSGWDLLTAKNDISTLIPIGLSLLAIILLFIKKEWGVLIVWLNFITVIGVGIYLNSSRSYTHLEFGWAIALLINFINLIPSLFLIPKLITYSVEESANTKYAINTTDAKTYLNIQKIIQPLFFISLFGLGIFRKPAAILGILTMIAWIIATCYYGFYKKEIGDISGFGASKPYTEVTYRNKEAVGVSILFLILGLVMLGIFTFFFISDF